MKSSLNQEKDEPMMQEQLTQKKSLFSRDVVEALKSGDSRVFKKIYLHLKVPLEKFLYLLLKSEDEARDVAQDTFITLWENRANLDPSKDLRSFIYRIARNKVVNLIVHSQVEERYVSEAVLGGEPETGALDEQLIARETQLLINLAVRNMPFMRRRVFELRQNEGLSNDEIAVNLQIPKENVANHLARAKKDIMERLKEPRPPYLLKTYFFLSLMI
jgi:RNA polymerase sigma-70 factor (ECF subfamily)